MTNNKSYYQIVSNAYSDNGEIVPIIPNSDNVKDIFKQFVYLRIAYPENITSLTFDGYILSTKEVSTMAHMVF